MTTIKLSKRNNYRPLIFNMVLWAISFAILLFAFSGEDIPQKIDYIYTGCFLATIIFPVLINLYILIPKFLKQEKYMLYCLLFIMNLFVFAQINIWFFTYIIDYLFPDYYFISYHSGTKLITLFVIFLVGTTLIRFSVDWIYYNRSENLRLKLRNQQIETQLALLRSQINPHFLFNSLNVIYSLAIENKAETKHAIVQLSDILRYVIYDSGIERVAIKEEVTLLKNYIEFHQFRHRQADNIKFHCSIDDENYQIHPMLMLPLLENSFKYGLKSDIENPYIHINLTLKNKNFIFSIENNYSEIHMENNNHSGVGIENIRKNLGIVYPKEHQFEIDKTEDVFRVTLKLFTNEN
ncbi:sensor histidine kinase [Aestuariivivens sediminis]|uniref:sensor histidine kinase n=1 Tax=Aestuariivivens sediminis TaxID=2913557 RepID=UPI001F578117|nr:sensor histidine kinase [Aestuariivivens sediminis]